MAEVEILRPGLFSTLQDTGRNGFLKFGVPKSGPMDSASAGIANLLLQNSAVAVVMEITQLGPKMAFSGPTEIAISGALLNPEINGTKVENNKVYKIHDGDILSFGKRKMGCRAYLAVKNGFQTEEVLGSRSWYTPITANERLKKGMRLEYKPYEREKFEMHAAVKSNEEIFSEEIDVFPGPEFELLTSAEKESLQKNNFSAGMDNNRMGIQLQEPLQNSLEPILTGPVLPGTVQLTPSGQLIVLMRDGQTTGGYPRILQLSEKGINSLAQKLPGEQLKFIILE